MSGGSRFVLGVLSGAIGYGIAENVYNRSKHIDIEYQEGVEAHKLQRGQEIFKYGAPDRGPEIRYYSNHALCYDRSKKIPLWVAEHLTADRMKGEANRRQSKFKDDPEVEEMFKAHNSDYYKSGWSRGHMAPAGNNKSSQAAMDETFYLSNILPQNYENNAGFWNRFEMYCRDLTKSFADVRIVSGPVMMPVDKDEKGRSNISYQVIGQNEVAVPTHLYKVIVAERRNGDPPLSAAFIVPNRPIGYDKELTDYQVPIEIVEKKSGLKFYPKLDRALSQNLCEKDACKLIERNKFELYFITRKLESSKTLHRLEKVWKELEEKNLKPDAWTENVYNKKKEEFTLKEKEQ